MKRKERYMGMFCGLGSSVLLKELDHVQLNFENVVEWAMEHLQKDDRIIWFLSLVQRGALLRIRNSSGRSIRPKIRRKIERKLKGFDDDRVLADLESDFTMNWPHYQSLAGMYQATLMKDYSFHFRKGKRLSPKSAGEILRDFEEMEERLQKLVGGDRFCTDGKPYLELENEWTWFAVDEGQSYQEAQAMRHCGNGGGRHGDILLSLREPVRKRDLLFWKPHLTFILNNGVLGEMKGHANTRPEKQFFPQISQLLFRSEIREVRGGGYLPQNNFAFCDMSIAQQEQSLQANPDLVVDPFGDDGQVLLEGKIFRWIESRTPDFPPRFTKRMDSSSSWVVFQMAVRSSKRTAWVSYAWCSLRKGMLGRLFLEREDFDEALSSSLVDILLLPAFKGFSMDQDPLSYGSDWGVTLTRKGCCKIMRRKPVYFRNSSLSAVWSLAGLSRAYLSVLNDRFGFSFRKTEDGIALRRFDSPLRFARETSNGRYIRSIQRLQEKSISGLPDESPFEVPWLKVRPVKKQKNSNELSLVLTTEGSSLFFEIMDFQALRDFRGLVPEIIYRFGLRTPSRN
ncbi:MAG: hypothetical protein HN494_05820 [Opitutae bacterium]|nr:hypothetical protein [Opitutae bacterium]